MNLESGPRKDFPRTEWTIGHRVRKKQSFQHEVKGEVIKISDTLRASFVRPAADRRSRSLVANEIPLCLES